MRLQVGEIECLDHVRACSTSVNRLTEKIGDIQFAIWHHDGIAIEPSLEGVQWEATDVGRRGVDDLPVSLYR